MLRPSPVSFEEIQFQALAMLDGEEIKPAVSIVIPVMNGADYIGQALESVIHQNFTDFEVIIVDDGSSDSTCDIVEEYTRRDSRFRLIRNPTNLGVAEAMNVCLDHARGRYIARLDADDVMLPSRLEQQIEYMERHPEVGMLGTAAYHIDQTSQPLGVRLQPKDDLTIRFQLLFSPPFYHPSCMYRAEVIRKHALRYNPDMRATEDFDFWQRMAKHTRMHNLLRPLILYRKHEGSISYRLKTKQQQEKIDIVQHFLLTELGLHKQDAPAVQNLLHLLHQHQLPAEGLRHVFQTFDRLLAAFVAKEGGKRSLYRLKGQAGKWIVKAILSGDVRTSQKMRLLAQFVLRLDYSVAFAFHALKSFLYSRFWAIKKPQTTKAG